jgi:hypothetical protein
MRKNAKLNERAAIVQKHDGTPENMTLGASGFKMGRAKLERWQKELKNMKISQNAIGDSYATSSESTHCNSTSSQIMSLMNFPLK